MKKIYFLFLATRQFRRLINQPNYGWIFGALLMLFSISAYSQKAGGSNNGSKDITVRSCTQYIGNGLYRVNFGYDNPNKKEITINEDDSYVISNKGKNKSKGVNAFKKGSVNKAFTREFSTNESVEWTVINPSGRVHTVVANANSSHCPPDESGFIFPVYGQGDGKTTDLYGLDGRALAKGTAGDSPSEIVYQLSDNKEKVLIEIVPISGYMQQIIYLLQNTYFVPNSDFLINPTEIVSKNLTTIDVYFPIVQLDNINLEITRINFIRMLHPSVPNAGIVTTQGDSIQRSNLVRDSFRIVTNGQIVAVDATDIKTGVISDSYDTQPYTGLSKATVDVLNGDLPGIGYPDSLYETPVQVLKEYAFGIASDEGRAMLQIIHDVAPGSELGFYSGILSPRDFELGVNLFMNEDYDIIVDDITFVTEPFFPGGRISKAIEDFTSLPGKTYFSSAGNFADNGYQSEFNSSQTSPQTNFLPSGGIARAHVFGNSDGSEDIYQKIHVIPGVYMIVLQWDEPISTQDISSGAITDLDIYLVDDFGNLIVGNNRVNEFGDPTEIIAFEAKDIGEANILITAANGAPISDLPIRYIAFRSNGLDFLEYGGAPTTSGHALSDAANIVAAVDIRTADDPNVQFFSSHGGTLSNGNYSEIDFSAPNGVFTNVPSVGQYLNSDDIFTSFFGTSASAPHAAACMALLMSVQASWFPDGYTGDYIPKTNRMSDQAIWLFKDNATSTGDEDIGGAGFINVEKVFKSIANQTPKILDLDVVDSSKIPGIHTVDVKITGEYFLSKDETTVTFEGMELEIDSITESEILVQIDPFTGGSGITVSSVSETPGGTDGGDSNTRSLIEDGKLAINIVADTVSIIFGQNPTYTYQVQGLPEGDEYVSTGLPEVKFMAPAAVFPYPDVGNYILIPYFDVDLTEEQLASYQINFINGIFNVTKNELTITPAPAEDTYTYGDAVEVILNYTYNEDGIEDNAAFLDSIKTYHQSDFYIDNSLIIINKLRAAVNEIEILNLLNEKSWMVTERTIQNKLRAAVNGMKLIDLEPQHFQDYMDAIIDPETNKLRAAVNKLRAAVNGQDLIENKIDMVIENKLRAAVNGTDLGNEDDKNNYSSIFAVIDAEDGSTETEERTIDKLYSMNLITGIEVTSSSEESYLIFPGALLHSVGANFIVTYESGNVTFSQKTLTASTQNLEINYGEALTSTNLTTVFEGFVFDEVSDSVFVDGIVPYYFVKDEVIYEMDSVRELGEYIIKVKNTKNYILDNIINDNYGTLKISQTILNAETDYVEVIYGDDGFNSSDLLTEFGDFAYPDEENEGNVFVDGVPYYFEDDELNRYEFGDKMRVGDYAIKIDGTVNYKINYGENHSFLRILPAPLVVKTTALEREYGDDILEALTTSITGWVYDDDSEESFFTGGNIAYIFSDEYGVKYEIDDLRELGIYEIEIITPDPNTDNYYIVYHDDHDVLTILPRHVNVKKDNEVILYGNQPTDFTVEFEEFAYDESIADVFGSTVVPYYLVDTELYSYDLDDKLEAGNYDIKIKETNEHYIFEYDSSFNLLTINKNILNIVVEDLIISQGDIPLFAYTDTGYVYTDNKEEVFSPGGITFYFVDDNGVVHDNTDVGVFTVEIANNLKNYSIVLNDAKIFINSSINTNKIRTYSDCVYYDTSPADGMNYTVIFRYENDNDTSVYVPDEDNVLSGPADYIGQLPSVFLPGTGTTKIRFDGKKLTWNLTSFGGTHKSSVSSLSTSESGECDAKSDETYEVYPNPVSDFELLTIEQKIPEISDVYVLNMYGVIVEGPLHFDGSEDENKIFVDMSSKPDGMYIVRIISSNNETRAFNIIKQ